MKEWEYIDNVWIDKLERWVIYSRPKARGLRYTALWIENGELMILHTIADDDRLEEEEAIGRGFSSLISVMNYEGPVKYKMFKGCQNTKDDWKSTLLYIMDILPEEFQIVAMKYYL